MFRPGKQYIIVVLAITIALSKPEPTFAQKGTTFQESFGGSSNEYGCALAVLPDKGYILGGITSSFGAGGYDILLIRTDSLGKRIWAKTYGGNNDEGIPSNGFNSGVDMVLTPDSNVVICSSTKSYGAGGSDVYFYKIDLNGNVKWSKTYGGTRNDYGHSVINDPSGGYMITGETFSYGQGNGDVFIIKTDTGGGVIWAKAYGSIDEEAGLQIKNSRDGNFLVTGYTAGTSVGQNELLMKVDKTGKLLFSRVYGTPSNDFAISVTDLPDSTIYTSGGTNSYLASIFSKYDKNGKLIWCKMYDQSQHVFTSDVLYDPIAKSFNAVFIKSGPGHMGIIRLDTSGKIAFTKIYGPIIGSGYYTDGVGSYLAKISSGFVLNYTTSVFGAGATDFFLIKVDLSASTTGSCNMTIPTVSNLDFTSYINDYSYYFTTISVTPKTGSGMTAAAASVKDSLICFPFLANFTWKTICIGQSAPFYDSSYYHPASWLWNFGDPGSSSNTSTLKNPTHNYSVPGTYTVKLISGNGTYSDSVTKTVIVLPNHSQLKTITGSFCPGDSVNLIVSGAGGVKFSWSPGSLLSDSTDSSVWAHPKFDTTFVVTIINNGGCTMSDSFIVKLSHLAPINLGGNRTSCTEPIPLSPGQYPGLTYLWSTGDNSDTIYVKQSGKYWLKVNRKGCAASDTAVVTILAPAEFDNDNLHNTLFCSDDSSLTLDAGSAYKYLWSPGGDTTQKIRVDSSGSYTVQITSPDGCKATKTIFITDQCTPYLFVPDAFTPNGNNLNDQFKPISRYPLEKYDMKIYNRWGERLFQSNDINIGWDGSFKNQLCPENVYLYIILYKFPYEIEQMKSGTVTLLR